MLFRIESNRRKNNTIARVTLGEENIMFWLEISDTAALNMV